MNDWDKKQIAEESLDEAKSKPSSGILISRRGLLGQAGKALYLAPTLTVLGLTSDVAAQEGSIPCPPPPPDDPCPPASAPASNPRTESNQRQNWKQKRRKDKG